MKARENVKQMESAGKHGTSGKWGNRVMVKARENA